MNHLNKLIKTHGKKNPHFIWKSIKTLQEMFYCNIAFIKGHIAESFYHYGELEIDSKLLIDDLVKLHHYGIFTVNGQGSVIESKKFINKTWKNVHNKECGNWYVSIEQKPFLCGFIEIKYFDELLKYLNNLHFTDDKIYYVFSSIDKPVITNLNTNCYTVTRDKSYYNIDDEEQTKWRDYTLFQPYEKYIEYETFNEYEDIYNIIKKDYIYFEITTKNYGSSISIEKTLLNFFREQ
jgi:hypothetical protein